MTDLVPIALIGVLVLALIVGIVQYRKFLATPWDEWDDVSQDPTNSSDEKD